MSSGFRRHNVKYITENRTDAISIDRISLSLSLGFTAGYLLITCAEKKGRRFELEVLSVYFF